MFRPVPDLPLCLSTGPGWPGEAIFLPKIKDIMIELIVYESVHLIQGPSKGPHNLTSTGPHLS
jgi:hypothetical protein